PENLESINQRATAAQAAKQSGVSQAYINRSVWKMTPSEIAQELTDRLQEQFETADATAGAAA
ncbi:hypothetical protein IAE22_35910, partial [Bacillus sp. S34]|nr:hypothetical protein [Bacillus sp. S34]